MRGRARPKSLTVRVASLNIRALPKAGLDNPVVRAGRVARAARVHGVDVLCLQELGDLQATALRENGWLVWQAPANERRPKPGGIGNGVAFRTGAKADGRVLDIPFDGRVLHIPTMMWQHPSGALLAVMSAHNPAGAAARDDRARCVELEADYIHRIEVPAVVGADLNERDTSGWSLDLASEDHGVDVLMGDVAWSGWRQVWKAEGERLSDHPLVLADATIPVVTSPTTLPNP